MVSRYLSLGLVLLLPLVYGLLQWLQIPAGHFIDRLIGAPSFEGLLIITTAPWNIYFYGKEANVRKIIRFVKAA